MYEVLYEMEVISTHSLTRRLTHLSRIGTHLSHISTHSLTRRLTAAVPASSPSPVFQLTASQGG